MSKLIAPFILAFAISFGTAWISPTTDEKAMYGLEGPVHENWLPRKVAGWPAPFLADNPDISVPHKIGVEDNFRLGPFIATLSFWFLVILAMGALLRSVIRSRSPK